MKTVDVEQGSVAWLEARCAIPTASEFDALITPLGEIRKGEGPKTYLARKLAEKWGGPLPGFSGSWFTDQGTIREGEAIPWANFEFGWGIKRVGLITTDDGRVGASPDGLIGDDGGIEIKCPSTETHVKYLLAGGLPKDYVAQVQGSLYVSGRAYWRFLSYCRHLPPLILTIQPDPVFQENLADALGAFLERFDDGWTQLLELDAANGGSGPPKREPMVFADDIINGRAADPDDVGIVP